MKLPATLMAIENETTFVISAAMAIEAAAKLRQRYSYLERVCQLLDCGETWIQDSSVSSARSQTEAAYLVTA